MEVFWLGKHFSSGARLWVSSDTQGFQARTRLGGLFGFVIAHIFPRTTSVVLLDAAELPCRLRASSRRRRRQSYQPKARPPRPPPWVHQPQTIPSAEGAIQGGMRQAVGLQPQSNRTQTQGVALGWYEAGRWPEGAGQQEVPSMIAATNVGNDKGSLGARNSRELWKLRNRLGLPGRLPKSLEGGARSPLRTVARSRAANLLSIPRSRRRAEDCAPCRLGFTPVGQHALNG